MPGLAELPLPPRSSSPSTPRPTGSRGERCELTEVGAVLVGGGELHDEWESLVGVAQPLGRGIQRFTGISQAMVDTAPPPEDGAARSCAAQLRGRVLVAHNARFDARVLQPGVRARGARVAGPAGAVHGRARAPVRAAAAPPRAGRRWPTRSGSRSTTVHRALPDARDVRAGVLRAVRAAVRERADDRRGARAAARPQASRHAPADAARSARAASARTSPRSRTSPGVYVFRDADGRAAVRRQVGRPAHARAGALHAPARRGRREAEHVDHQVDGVRARRAAARGPADQGAASRRATCAASASPTATSTCAAGWTSRSRSSRSRASPPPATPSASARCAGRAAAAELVEQLNSLFGLRHCGRTLPRREHPSAYGQMGRCLSPCLHDLDPNLYRERLDAALAAVRRPRRRRARCSPASTSRSREASRRAALRARRLAAAPPRRGCEALLEPARRRPARDPHRRAARARAAPRRPPGRFDAFWIAGGRVVDWGALPDDPAELARAAPPTRCAPRRGRSSAAGCRADAIAEARLVGLWIAAHEPRAHELTPGTDPGVLAARLSGPSARAA